MRFVKTIAYENKTFLQAVVLTNQSISTGGSLRNPSLEIPVFFKIQFIQTISDDKTPKIKVVRLKKL
jgi:hypothetical protein